uniref:RNA-binding protein 41 n=1 Tax=Iconisemion striatum TaxID=60296 RepID=A0A1A7Y1K9_9TELE
MQRVTRRVCEEGPLLEEQETEGQRQLHSLLLQQLHTDVDIDRCVAKRQCFAPAALYRPFGEQAAGVRSLSQFQALQDGEQELARLRELGLTEAEIQLWRSRDASEKSHGVCPAPDARQQRLQVIRDKMGAREELLSRPQRFAASRPLSRREMEIERALFQGSDRQGFLSALYHRDEDDVDGQQEASSSDPMGSLYRDILTCQKNPGSTRSSETVQSQSSQSSSSLQSSHRQSDLQRGASEQQDNEEKSELQPPVRINLNQPIGSLCGAAGAGSGGRLAVSGEIKTITEEEILNSRAPEEEIRSIPRFRNYQPGKPSKVLCVKNVSQQASVAQLVALFSRYEQKNGPPVLYRLLTGRMKGQAFITLPDAETAQNALQLVHGYRLLGKPLVVEFGYERQEGKKRMERDKIKDS